MRKLSQFVGKEVWISSSRKGFVLSAKGELKREGQCLVIRDKHMNFSVHQDREGVFDHDNRMSEEWGNRSVY